MSNDQYVPFGYLAYPNGSEECEESSLCTWANPQKTRAIPYCYIHNIACSPELMGCYTDSTCGGNVLPFVAPSPPSIIIPNEEVVAPPPPIASTSDEEQRRKRLILIIVGVIVGLLFIIALILMWRFFS